MLARLIVEARRRAPAAHLQIAGLVLAVGHVIQRDIGNDSQRGVEPLVDLALRRLAAGDEILDGAHFRLEGLSTGLVARLHGLADFLGGGIAPGLRILQLLDMVAPFSVDLQEVRRHGRQPASGEAPVERVRIFADGLDIVHVSESLYAPSYRTRRARREDAWR